MLVPGVLPNDYSLRNFNVSAHYGLIGWDGFKGKFYSVTIANQFQPVERSTGKLRK